MKSPSMPSCWLPSLPCSREIFLLQEDLQGKLCVKGTIWRLICAQMRSRGERGELQGHWTTREVLGLNSPFKNIYLLIGCSGTLLLRSGFL